jgi:hypothetical protein
VRAKGGHFGEDFAYGAKDIRFTSKGEKTLYAFAMGWPADGKIVIRSLAKFPEVTGKITGVSLLGAGEVKWTHAADGLEVQLPAQKPCDYAVALKITGEDLRGFKPELALPQVQAIQPDAGGNFTLGAEDAEMHGEGVKTENQGGQPNIGFWDNAQDWVSWKVKFKEPGSFKVSASCAAANRDSALAVEIAGQKVEAKVPATGAWDKFTTIELGAIEVREAREQIVKVRPRDPQAWSPVNLRWVKLSKSPQ